MEDQKKLRIRQAVIVEGKYDKIKLDALIDGLILPTHGFGIFKNTELKQFIRRLAAERGVIVLTDSDGAGFKIRSYLRGMLPPEQITNVFIPDLYGKEKRKRSPSAEGKLGVEGMELETLRKAFALAGIDADEPLPVRENPITRQTLYEDGLSGGEDSRALRYALYDKLGIPRRLNVTAALPLLNSLLTWEEYTEIIASLREAAE